MEHGLSQQNEQYLEKIVAGGLFPSKHAALDAAVAALREKTEILFVSDEHMDAVEQGIDEADAGLGRPMTNEDWSQLRQRARNVASGANPGNS